MRIFPAVLMLSALLVSGCSAEPEPEAVEEKPDAATETIEPTVSPSEPTGSALELSEEDNLACGKFAVVGEAITSELLSTDTVPTELFDAAKTTLSQEPLGDSYLAYNVLLYNTLQDNQADPAVAVARYYLAFEPICPEGTIGTESYYALFEE